MKNVTNQIKSKIGSADELLWRDLSEAPVLLRAWLVTLRIVYAVIRDLRDGQLSLRAMSLVYNTVIAIVPLLALSFSVLKGFGIHENVEPALLEAMVDLGDKRYDIVENVMGFINNVNIGVLGSVGFAILIYSVISMMQKIEAAFNYTWQIGTGRNFSERFRDYLGVIFVGPLLIFLSAAVTTSVGTSEATNYISSLPYASHFISFVAKLLPYLLMAIGFAVTYIFLPNTKVTFLSAFVGGLVTALAWKLMGWGISSFVANSASSMAIYSAFASVIILMVWMYVGWLVLLVGASVAFYFQNPEFLRVRKSDISISYKDREGVAIDIMLEVARRFSTEIEAPTINALAKKLSLPVFLTEDIVDILLNKGFLIISESHQHALYPSRSISTIKVSDIVLCMRDSVLGAQMATEPSYSTIVKEFEANTKASITSALGGKSLADCIEQ